MYKNVTTRGNTKGHTAEIKVLLSEIGRKKRNKFSNVSTYNP